jgi:RND family efflux transporter MFP subunit
MRLSFSRLFLVGSVVVLFGGLAVWHYAIKPGLIAKAMASMPQPPAVVSTEPAKLTAFASEVPAIGTVEAVNGVLVTTEVGATITAILFQSGAQVRKGEPLAQLSAATEAADISLFQAQLREAEQQMARVQPLVQQGTLAKAALDRAVAARDAARAQVERARADFGKRVIRAPFSGRLGIRQANVGQYLNPGDPIVSLQAVDPIYVTFDLPERKLAQTRVGLPVSVTVDAFPGRLFTGRVTTVDAAINPSTRNVRVQATLRNEEGALAPGMFANVLVEAGEGPSESVSVAETAIAYSLSGDAVFVLKPTQEKDVFIAEQRAVRVGDSANGRVQILSGVQPGDLVVIAGQGKLRPGAKATVNNTVSLTPPERMPKE